MTRFFRSVAGKLFSALALCILVLLLFNWLLNSFAFQRYYEREQTVLLTTAYKQVDEALQNRQNVEHVLSDYVAKNGMGATVWSGYRLLFSTDPELSNTVFVASGDIAMPAGEYTVRNSKQNGEHQLLLFGRNRGGVNVILWVSLASIENGVAIVNRFLWWSALATLVFGFIGIYFVSRSVTRPVQRLSAMAQGMARLDFSKQYSANGSRDELAELGQSLNFVSQSMAENLAALKTANAKLLADVEQKEKQDEARTRFIRNVSHELKTPLSLIQNYAEGLHENAADDAASREFYCTVIEEEAQKLSLILHKLTLLMQLESGKEELQIEQFDIVALTARLIERYAPLFAEHTVALPVVGDEPHFVWGDAALIENVLTNYLTNALNHVTDGGEIRVDFTKGKQRTRIAVFNTGTPIPEEDLPHLWESFYKVDKARTREYGGTGIGLSVVAAIMNAHHLPYGVQNTENGVEFYIEM